MLSVTVCHRRVSAVLCCLFDTLQLLQHGCHAAYFSPSITYCAHPRYARVYVADRDGTRTYWQLVVEVRVDQSRVDSTTSDETLAVGAATTIDPKYPGNKHIEYLAKAGPSTDADVGDRRYVRPEDGVVVTGVMVRVLEEDPMDLPDNAWWAAWATRQHIDLHEPGKYYKYGDADKRGDTATGSEVSSKSESAAVKL